MGKPRIDEAVRPVSFTNQRSSDLTALYDLSMAKNALGLPEGDHEDDGQQLLKIRRAQAICEEVLGYALSPETTTLEYAISYYGASVLLLPFSDITGVTAVRTYDNAGAATALDASKYETTDWMDQTYLRRTDGECFEGTDGISVDVTATREVQKGTKAAAAVEILMNFCVVEMNRMGGITAMDDIRKNPAFDRLVCWAKANTLMGTPIGQ